MSSKEKVYPADRPLRAWKRYLDEKGEPNSDVAFAVGQTWEDETPRWFNVSLMSVEGRTTVESAELLEEGVTEDDLRSWGYYRATVGGMLNFVDLLAGFVKDAEKIAADNRIELDKVRHELGDEKAEVERLKRIVYDVLEDTVREFCWINEYVDDADQRRKDFYAPATEIDVYRMAEEPPGEPLTWYCHEFVYDSSSRAYRLARVRVASDVSRDALEERGCKPASVGAWLGRMFHTAKDLEGTNLEIGYLRRKLSDRAGVAEIGKLAASTLESFCWVTEWQSYDNTMAYRSVYIPRTDHEAELIARGRADRPISWVKVSSQRRTAVGSLWEVSGVEQVDAVTLETLEEAGAEPRSTACLRAHVRVWAEQAAILRAKLEHPSSASEVERLRAQVSELEKVLEDERQAHADRIEGIAASFQSWADSHGLDGEFDDLMIENGLPSRKRSWSVAVQVPLSVDVIVTDCATDDEAMAEAADRVLHSVTADGFLIDGNSVAVAGRPGALAADQLKNNPAPTGINN